MNSSTNGGHLGGVQSANSIPERGFVHGVQLANIHGRWFWQPGRAAGQRHIARGFGAPHVGRDQTYDSRPQAGVVEDVILDYHARASLGWGRP